MFKLKISNIPIKNFYNLDLETHKLFGTQLKDKSNRILYNIFQYSQVYPEFLENDQLLSKYYEWRKSGMNSTIIKENSVAGQEPIYFLKGKDEINLEPLDKVQARKKIYFQEYKAIVSGPSYKSLIQDFTKSLSIQNVCIIDPKAEKQILVSKSSLKTLFESPNPPLDGMCLAMVLMGWTVKDLDKPLQVKETWKNTTLFKYVEKHRIKGWEFIFNETILPISKFLQEKSINPGASIFPPIQDVFKVFELCHLENIKICILGQDPYISPNQAMGIAFSVHKNIKCPPSLINIFNELIMEGYVEYAKHSGDLTDWVKKGIFLYNVCLTVNEKQSNSHGKIWDEFSKNVISSIDEFKKDKMVWILLGANAQLYKKYIKYGKTLETTHPSPLSARKGFLGSNIFKQASEYLRTKGGMDKDIWSINK